MGKKALTCFKAISLFDPALRNHCMFNTPLVSPPQPPISLLQQPLCGCQSRRGDLQESRHLVPVALGVPLYMGWPGTHFSQASVTEGTPCRSLTSASRRPGSVCCPGAVAQALSCPFWALSQAELGPSPTPNSGVSQNVTVLGKRSSNGGWCLNGVFREDPNP